MRRWRISGTWPRASRENFSSLRTAYDEVMGRQPLTRYSKTWVAGCKKRAGSIFRLDRYLSKYQSNKDPLSDLSTTGWTVLISIHMYQHLVRRARLPLHKSLNVENSAVTCSRLRLRPNASPLPKLCILHFGNCPPVGHSQAFSFFTASVRMPATFSTSR